MQVTLFRDCAVPGRPRIAGSLLALAVTLVADPQLPAGEAVRDVVRESAHATSADQSLEKDGEKLILGFEMAELARGDEISRVEKPGKESWFFLLERPQGFDFAARFEWPGETNRAWTWRCRPGACTQGDSSLVASVGPVNTRRLAPTYQQTDFLSRYYPALRAQYEAHPLLTTFQWLAKADPGLRNWKGYDLLRVDVRCDTTPVELWLAVEDEILEPPVARTYNVPAGEWVTLEVDLNEAVRARQLELAKIANIWLLGRASARGEMWIDNVRIATRNVPAAARVVRDESPMELPAADPVQRPLPRVVAGGPRDNAPIDVARPVVVARGSIVPFGWVAAYDNRHLFVAYSGKEETEGKPVAVAMAVASDDGGATWKPLPSAAARNLDHGTARGCAVDAMGDGVAVSSGPGCAGLGHAAPRQHLTKYTFTGSGWAAESPTILDSDIRHCGSNASVARVRTGPHCGRLWASWGQIGRLHRMGVHVKYSEDDGRTWQPWGRGAALPGAELPEWSNGTYGYPETVVTPYRDHVACFWRHKRDCGIMWSMFDGSRWSLPQEVSAAVLNRLDGSYRATMSAVTRGADEIFFAATGLPSVMRWNGQAWSEEPVAGDDSGMLSLAGDVVTLFTSGEVNRRWQGIDWSRRTSIRCSRRLPDGRWHGPQDLTGEFNLHEYRSLAGFSVPPYAPPNYVPLVWSDYDEGTVKLLRVPVVPSP